MPCVAQEYSGEQRRSWWGAPHCAITTTSRRTHAWPEKLVSVLKIGARAFQSAVRQAVLFFMATRQIRALVAEAREEYRAAGPPMVTTIKVSVVGCLHGRV
jgi:hypothetical protein